METATLIGHSLVYLVFFLSSWIAKNWNYNRLINEHGVFTTKPQKLILFHFFGIVWLGILPVLAMKPDLEEIVLGSKPLHFFLWTGYLLVFLLIMGIAAKQAQKEFLTVRHKLIVETRLPSDFFAIYFFVRILFLIAYELWFRGLFLSDCISGFGITLAVAINLFLYVLVHIFNSRKEMLACVPFGLLVCALSILFDAVWPVILLHVGFSFMYEYILYQSNINHSKIIKS